MSDRLTPRQSADIRNAAARIRLTHAEKRADLGLPTDVAATLWDAAGEWAEVGTTVMLLAREHDHPRLAEQIEAARLAVEKVGKTVTKMRGMGELPDRAGRPT